MKVVITSATNFEAERIKENIGKCDFVNDKNLQVAFNISGIGILSSSYSITKLLLQQKPDLIIQVGIAGCFDTNISLSKVVVIKEEFIGDMGVEENGIFKDLFDMRLQHKDDFPTPSLAHSLKPCAKEDDIAFNKKNLINPWLDQYNLLKLDEVIGITINEISTRKDRIDFIKNKYHPVLESMEGAALHYVCLQMQVPFIQVRSISNYIGERDKTKWKMNDAITNLTDVMIRYLDALANRTTSNNKQLTFLMKLSLGFSPCPNDTFIFDALVNNKIDTEGFEFDVHLEDVQTLNERALQQQLDVSKISYGVLPLVLNDYVVLNSGGALGQGVGPLLISKKNIDDLSLVNDITIAIPGENTTAHMLFTYAFPEATNKKFLVFNQIEDAVLNGDTYAGVIIHENRFTYQNKGLIKLMDLGEYWEQQTSAPIPLGGIIVKRSLDKHLQKKLEILIRKSVEYSFNNYPKLSTYVTEHSQEMSEDVMRKHIDLYVNDFSIDLKENGKKAVIKLLEIYDQLHNTKTITHNIFVD